MPKRSRSASPGASPQGRGAPPRAPAPAWEWAAAAVIIAIGLALRIAALDRAAVEHFDEGVYASNLWFPVESGGQYPRRELYAPPLAPLLIELSIIATGDTRWGPLLPSLAAGILTVALVWWVGRAWFSPGAGLAAAALASLSEFHILYSRAALTDVPLGLFLLLSLYCFERAWRAALPAKAPLSSEAWKWSVAAGLACGAAWSTKHNGWLPLAISLAAVMGWSLFQRQDARGRGSGAAILWLAMAITAALAWLPAYLSLPDGYAPVAENHRGYVTGLSGWPRAMSLHREFFAWLSSGLTLASLCAAALIAGAGRWQGALAVAAITGASAWLSGAVEALFALAVAGYGVRRAMRDATGARDSHGAALYGEWLTTAWLAGLTAATPLYHAYPRLAIPWLIALWLAAGAGMHSIIQWLSDGWRNGGSRSRLRWSGAALAATGAAILVASAATRPIPSADFFRRSPAWQDRTGALVAAEEIKRMVDQRLTALGRSPDEALVLVYGEPALFFHLRAAGVAALPANDPLALVEQAKSTQAVVFLATGLQQAEALESRQHALASAGAVPLAAIPCRVSDVVLTDHLSLWQKRRLAPRVEGRMLLYTMP